MRILQIIDGLGTGGAEKLLVDTVPLLVDKGFVVDVLLLNGERTPFYFELEKTHSCTIFSLGKSYYNPLYIFKMASFFKKYDLNGKTETSKIESIEELKKIIENVFNLQLLKVTNLDEKLKKLF